MPMPNPSTRTVRAPAPAPEAWLALPLALLVLALSVVFGIAGAQGADDSMHGVTRPDRTPPTRAELRAVDNRYAGTDANPAAAAPAAKTAAKRAALFPRNRIVALYGSAHPGFGALGRRRPDGAKRRIRKQSIPYRRQESKPVIRAFDLVATVATQCERRRDKCRYRISDSTVQRYLNKIRELNGMLILDIQPGRSTFLDEVEYWRTWLRQPYVGLALDPEWNVGRRGQPGETVGSVRARQLNRVSKFLQNLVERRELPDKPMIVHQFRRGSIHHRGAVKQRADVDVTLNFDGIGAPRPKRSGYRRMQKPPLFNGFSLFYQLDTDLMSPRQVLNLRPPPDYVMYQ